MEEEEGGLCRSVPAVPNFRRRPKPTIPLHSKCIKDQLCFWHHAFSTNRSPTISSSIQSTTRRGELYVNPKYQEVWIKCLPDHTYLYSINIFVHFITQVCSSFESGSRMNPPRWEQFIRRGMRYMNIHLYAAQVYCNSWPHISDFIKVENSQVWRKFPGYGCEYQIIELQAP